MTTFERIAAALAPQYHIERELGHGALGTTWRATSADGAPAAVKVLFRRFIWARQLGDVSADYC